MEALSSEQIYVLERMGQFDLLDRLIAEAEKYNPNNIDKLFIQDREELPVIFDAKHLSDEELEYVINNS